MASTKYTATFSDGQVIKRTSPRVYAFAWRVKWVAPVGYYHEGQTHVDTGWSRSKELAEAAAHAAGPRKYAGLTRSGRRAKMEHVSCERHDEVVATVGVAVKSRPAQAILITDEGVQAWYANHYPLTSGGIMACGCRALTKDKSVYNCTRPVGHAAEHVAHVDATRAVARWRNDPEVA